MAPEIDGVKVEPGTILISVSGNGREHEVLDTGFDSAWLKDVETGAKRPARFSDDHKWVIKKRQFEYGKMYVSTGTWGPADILASRPQLECVKVDHSYAYLMYTSNNHVNPIRIWTVFPERIDAYKEVD